MTLKKLLIAVVLACISFGIGAYIRFNTITIPTSPTRPDVITPTPVSTDQGDGSATEGGDEAHPIEMAGRVNILVVGEDNVERVKRSDTMLFVAVDIDDKNVRVLSLPRDTRVSIPRHGNQKLNHAYAFGGIDLLRATIERFLGTTIHYYVKIDYDNFPRLVDLVGGVDIFVGKAMKYTDRKQNLFIDIKQGKQRMNGDTALKYVRFRNDAMGDIGRIRRQQQFLKGFLHRIYDTENLLRFPTVMDGIKETLTTDMEPSVILQLGSFIRRLEKDQDKVLFKMLPGEAAIVEGLSYWIADRRGIESFLTSDFSELSELPSDVSTAADFSPDKPEGSKATDAAELTSVADVHKSVGAIHEAVAILNGSGKAGVAANISTYLQKMGVDVAHVGNAKHFDYRSSIVIYPTNATPEQKASASSLAELCGISQNLVRGDAQASYVSLVIGHDHGTVTKRLKSAQELAK